ncbi:MoaD/ThiS family protein [Spongiivirga sp. MCCC 1A20706]|uniref:MoaD/ThiS family protein n=1 Tax=Spongiivirga sp. MCCC 1A20706 TaxID=3160963 RepID=UPI003977C235
MNILLFGIAKDIVGQSVLEVEDGANSPRTVGELKNYIVQQYPKFQELSSLAIAVNSNYASDMMKVNDGDEVAIIPPVSGG